MSAFAKCAGYLIVAGLFLGGCASSSNRESDLEEEALRAGMPLGTYVHRSGPSGTLGSEFDSQSHVTRLTVKAGNKFDAEVLVEVRETFPLPTVKTERVIEHGTLEFTNDQGKHWLTVGDAGSFLYQREGDRLTLSSGMGAPRTVVLERDPSWRPSATTPIKLHCVSRNPREGDPTIDVTLDGESNESGRAIVKSNGNQFWPPSGTYPLELDRADADGWRHLKGFAGNKGLELDFPVADLDRRSGTFEGGGGYGEGRMFTVNALSERCTHVE